MIAENAEHHNSKYGLSIQERFKQQLPKPDMIKPFGDTNNHVNFPNSASHTVPHLLKYPRKLGQLDKNLLLHVFCICYVFYYYIL